MSESPRNKISIKMCNDESRKVIILSERRQPIVINPHDGDFAIVTKNHDIIEMNEENPEMLMMTNGKEEGTVSGAIYVKLYEGKPVIKNLGLPEDCAVEDVVGFIEQYDEDQENSKKERKFQRMVEEEFTRKFMQGMHNYADTTPHECTDCTRTRRKIHESIELRGVNAFDVFDECYQCNYKRRQQNKRQQTHEPELDESIKSVSADTEVCANCNVERKHHYKRQRRDEPEPESTI